MKSYRSFRKDDKQNLLLVVVSAILFYTNEAVKFKVEVPYLGYLLRNHFNDFLGGVSFIALVNAILFFSIYNKIKKLGIILIIGVGCSIVWELITPIFLDSSTGDFWDAVSYSLGFTLYWMIKRFINKDKAYTV